MGEDGASTDVILVGIGKRKQIHVIKALRGLLGTGLGETKDLVDHLPSRVAAGLTPARAEEVASVIREAGGVVEMHPAGAPAQAGELALSRERAERLSGAGALTADELARLRDALGSGAGADTIHLLESLHELHERGVLSEAEFNTKKWDLLTRL